MAFDLYITFAGLCLFRRPKKEEKEWIEVLLPPTEGHAHCRADASGSAPEPAVPGHFARLGYHVRYDPTLTGSPGKRFKEFDFAGKRLDLTPFGGRPLNREFRHMDVVDVTDVMENPLKPKRAIGRVKMSAGSLCPGSVCEHSRGARWKIPGKKPTQHMSTLVTWRIRGVKEVVQGGEGLKLKVADLESGAEETYGILRPVGGQIRIYVFHTPYDELPSQGIPHFDKWTSEGMKGTEPTDPTKADHFLAYYDLFPGPQDRKVPEFVDEGEDDEDETGRESPRANLDAASKPARVHVGLGRRYNCILTVVEDEGEE